MKTRIIIGIVIAVLLVGTFAYGDWKTKQEHQKAADALVAVAMLTGKLDAAHSAATVALTKHEQDSVSLLQQQKQTATWSAQYASLKSHPVTIIQQAPDTCTPYLVALQQHADSIQHAADSVIAGKTTENATLQHDNGQMATTLVSVRSALADSSGALAAVRKQLVKDVVSPASISGPRKLLGLIPLPQVWGGYGATFDPADHSFHTGVQVTLGYHIAF